MNFRATIGVLLVGHGTRNEIGRACVAQLEQLVAARLRGIAVQHCFLELSENDIPFGLRQLQGRGVSRVLVAPLLLFDAGHAKADIPAAVQASLERNMVLVGQTAALGCHPAIIELSHRRLQATLAQHPPVPAGKSCLLMVGRGSRDEQATTAMHEFARLCAERAPGMTVEVAFIAMAQPSVDKAIDIINGNEFTRVIVQPHLLFPGELLDNLGTLVERQRQVQPQTEWLLTEPLAADLGSGGLADELLVTAVVDRIREAMSPTRPAPSTPAPRLTPS